MDMPVTSESIAALPPLQRRMAEAWLTRFEENWNEQKLRECMQALPGQSSLRRPLLIAMIEQDLGHHWDAGQPTVIESYLKEYPELGGIDEIPIELLAAEYKARQKHQHCDLADFAERFPTRIDDLYVFLKPGIFEEKAPAARATTTDSMSIRRLKLLRAPADANASEPISERRAKLLRQTGPNSPPTPQVTSETVQDDAPPASTHNSGMILPPAPAQIEPARATNVAPSQDVWLDIQTVRSNHAAGRSGVIKPQAAMPPMPPPILGRYAIEKRLGSSGFGSLYLATDTEIGRRTVLRIPAFSGPNAAADRARFQRDSRAAAALFHPLLCPVFDAGQIEGVDFLAMPLVDGDPLADLLKQRPIWPARQAIDLISKLAIALDALHRTGLVHRDLKPSNILLAPGETPVIAGLGQMSEPLHSKRTGNAIYVAPEQSTLTADSPDPRSDIYSLGVILHQMLTGKLPQPSDGIYFFPPDLDERLQSACCKAVAINPAERWGSMREFVAELTACRQSLRPSDLGPRFPLGGSWPRRTPGSAHAVSGPTGLSAVPLASPPTMPPAAGNTAYAQMQELRNLSTKSAPGVRPVVKQRRSRTPNWKPWQYLVAGAVGGFVLIATVFALSSMQKRAQNKARTNPPEQHQSQPN
jgi:serine/threonine protein kinase